LILKTEAKFNSIYEIERKKIDKRLRALLKNRQPGSLYKPGSYILESSGKRIRPMLVLFSTRATGGKFADSYNAAVAVELLHNFTLVHDDIMDNAEKRRGLATLHKRYDLSTAILAGDSLLSVAYESLLKDLKLNCKPVMAAFTKGLVEVCEGQSLDKEFELKKNVTIPGYKLMIRKKTAEMIEMCCTVGGYIGNGTKREINALANFGRNIGMAFQIQDDLLDAVADETKFGKFVGGDLREGKKTFLFLKSLEKAKGNDKKLLKLVIENKGVKKNKISEYQRIYRRLGVIEDAKKEIKNYTNRALKQLAVLKSKEDRELFHKLADYLINRNK
jgi:geranylgeranyl diphosphate synthase type II